MQLPTSSSSSKIDVDDDISTRYPSSSVEYFLEAIGEALEDLSHVGVAIRKSSQMTETARARKYVSERSEISPFETLCFIALETLHPSAPDSLLQQLCESMVNRYARHLYRAPRQKVLENDSRQPSVPAKTEKSPQETTPATVSVHIQEQSSRPLERREHAPPTILLSSVNSSQFNRFLRIHRTQKSRSGTTVVLSKTRDPPLPPMDESGQLRCEWCFCLIDQNLIEDDHWTSLGRYERQRSHNVFRPQQMRSFFK